MTPLDAGVLGLIQGIAEWLPVSSSGHLDIAMQLMGYRDPSARVAFTLFLHLATLLAALWTFRRDIARLATDRRTQAVWLIVATVPAGLAGLLLKHRVEGLFASPTLTGAALIATGAALLAAQWFARGSRAIGEEYERVHGAFPKGLPAPTGAVEEVAARDIPAHLASSVGIDPEVEGEGPERTPELFSEAPSLSPIPELADGPWPTASQAIAMGVAQIAALVPGISRSGSTLVAGLFAGLDRSRAVPYAFLLGLPLTAGAVLMEARKCAQSPLAIEPISWSVGFIVAGAVSLVAIGPALRFLTRRGVGGIGGYCVAAGSAVCAASVAGLL